MRFFLILIVLVFAQTKNAYSETVIHLTDDEVAFLSEHKKISVHMEEGYAPFSFVSDGELTGYSVEFANLIAERLGVTFQYNRNVSWDQAIADIKEGKLDIIAQMKISPERKNFVNFTSNYMRYFNSIVLLKSRKDQLNTIEKLNHKKVGIVGGYLIESVLSEHFPEINLVTFPDTNTLLNGVILGKIDAAISTHQVVQNDILTRFITDIVSLPILDNTHLPEATEAFGVKKEYPLLRSAIQRAIDSLGPEKVRLQIKWFGESDTSAVVFTPQEAAFIETFGPLKYCIDPSWKPLEYINDNNQHQGLSADVLKKFTEKSGIVFELVPTESWLESLSFLQSRRCDLLPLAMQTQERKKFMSVTAPYMDFPLVIATQTDVPFISDLNAVLDKTFAVAIGYAHITTLRKNYPGIKIIEADSILDGLEHVTTGKAFGFIDTVPTISQGIAENNLVGIKIAGQLTEKWELGVGVRSDLPLLLDIMKKNVSTLQQADRQSLLNRWIGVRYEKGFNYALFWKVLAVIAVVGVIVMLRYFVMSRINKKLKIAYDEVDAAKKELEKIVVADHLTGLFNRKKLDNDLKSEVSRAQRYKHPLGLVLLDIDHFKIVNDTFGHDVGDQVLIKMAEILKNNSRGSDIVGRWGGEEFLIICPETKQEDLICFAEQLRKKIAQTEFPTISKKTVSLGVTVYRQNDTLYDFMKRADEALYKAKDNGRNKTEAL